MVGTHYRCKYTIILSIGSHQKRTPCFWKAYKAGENLHFLKHGLGSEASPAHLHMGGGQNYGPFWVPIIIRGLMRGLI